MGKDQVPENSEYTLRPSGQFKLEGEVLLPTLTILWHPDRSRIGASAPLLWSRNGDFELSRWTPLFRHGNEPELSLEDRHVSRSPVILKQVAPDGISIQPPPGHMPIQIDGRYIESPLNVGGDSLENGLLICLGRSVALCLHRAPVCSAYNDANLGLAGSGQQMERVRQQIRRAARTNASVLIRGETGTGKELVARAIHKLSERGEQQMVSVNMATLGGELAAAELFGVRQGAYTGAHTSRPGLFCEADGSTLFMDEIGDASPLVQVMLLRILEDGQLRALGDTRDRSVDVRILAATDRPLEKGTNGCFNQPLRRRLEAITIHLPPLRQRREDFGELFAKFIGAAEVELGHPIHISADLVCTLAAKPWTGNVRELKNFVTRLAISVAADGKIHWDDELARYFSIESSKVISNTKPETPRRTHYRDPVTVSDSDLIEALNNSGWRVMPAAKALGVSRTSMYALLKQCPEVRSVDDISTEEINRAMAQAQDLDTWAIQLKTPREALKRRISELELA